MIPFFPKQIANKGIIVYLISLGSISIVFFNHAMNIGYILMGLMWVIGFFLLSSNYTKKWLLLSSKDFSKSIFWAALWLRLGWMLFSYFFFISKTGQPFEFDAADAVGYHEEAKEFASYGLNAALEYWSNKVGVSDTGYPFWLTLIYIIFGPSIIMARTIKCIISSVTCVLLYKLARRTIGDIPGRMAAVFCTFIPNLIFYCGLHLKETEMMFLIVAFLERTDFLIRKRSYHFSSLIVPFILALSLFFFRTILGVIAIISLYAGVLFTNTRFKSTSRKIIIFILGLAIFTGFYGGKITTEIKSYWDMRITNETLQRETQTNRGNLWAKYATGSVLAPMEFVLPFATMVDTDQDNQMLSHSGNYVKNFLGIFILISIYYALLKNKNWKKYALIGSFVITYLGVVAVSGFGNSERFLLPAQPAMLIFVADGISKLNSRNIKYVNAWYAIVFCMEIGWTFFKIGSRGLL